MKWRSGVVGLAGLVLATLAPGAASPEGGTDSCNIELLPVWVGPGTCSFSCRAGDDLAGEASGWAVKVTATCGGVTRSCTTGYGAGYWCGFAAQNIVQYDDANGTCTLAATGTPSHSYPAYGSCTSLQELSQGRPVP